MNNTNEQDRLHRDFRAIDCFMKNVDRDSRFYTFAQEKAITDEEVYDLLLAASYSIGFINNFTGNATAVNLITQIRERDIQQREKDFKNRLADAQLMCPYERKLFCEMLEEDADAVVIMGKKRTLEWLLRKNVKNKKFGNFSIDDYISKIYREGGTISIPINTKTGTMELVRKCHIEAASLSERIFKMVRSVKAGRARANIIDINRAKAPDVPQKA